MPEYGLEYSGFTPLGRKSTKNLGSSREKKIFTFFGRGIATSRDEIVYDFSAQLLKERAQNFVEQYNSEVDRYKRCGNGKPVDGFVHYDRIKWSRDLKLDLMRGNYAVFTEAKIRTSLYRPFSRRYQFFDRILNEEVYLFPRFFPAGSQDGENVLISLTDIGSEKPFMTLVASNLTDLHLVGAGSSSQCFPFYTYDEDGSNRRENITEWALGQFRQRYDSTINKWDIFHYVYGILHHPGYREKFSDNLKRELPRIPFSKDFWAFAKAGKELATLHLDYEKVEPYPLRWVETEGVPLSYRVDAKMRLSKDKKSLWVNPSLTLSGIPPKVFDYRLGNRSALEWVIDQYRVTEDKNSGIRSDPNRAEDEKYIVNLVCQVVQVSLETVRIVASLPSSYGGDKAAEED